MKNFIIILLVQYISWIVTRGTEVILKNATKIRKFTPEGLAFTVFPMKFLYKL